MRPRAFDHDELKRLVHERYEEREQVWGAERILAGRLGHLHGLRPLSHLQQRRKRRRHSCCLAHRFCVLLERSRHRLGMVGDRLSRGMGLGGDLFLWHSRQRPERPGPLSFRKPLGQSAMQRRRRRAGRQPAGLERYSSTAPVPGWCLWPRQPSIARRAGGVASGRLRTYDAPVAQPKRRCSSA